MSDSVRPQRRQPTRLPRPWDSPGKNTGVGCHFLLQCMKVKVKSLSCARLFTTPWTIAYQALPSLGFSRLEYWSGLDNIKFYLLTQYAIKLVYQSLREYTHTHPSKNIFEQQGKKTLDFKETLFILLHKQNVIGYSFTSLMAKLEIET